MLTRTVYRTQNIIISCARLHGSVGVRETDRACQQRVISTGDSGTVNPVASHSGAATSLPIQPDRVLRGRCLGGCASVVQAVNPVVTGIRRNDSEVVGRPRCQSRDSRGSTTQVLGTVSA
jgi:hypothetical protein